MMLAWLPQDGHYSHVHIKDVGREKSLTLAYTGEFQLLGTHFYCIWWPFNAYDYIWKL